ncbi:hypothetical protein CLOM621_07914 [Clostridium sp. M62/1]|nr:hypothetical protein CLOM621_07914 [Clostridium sp. M62/1]
MVSPAFPKGKYIKAYEAHRENPIRARTKAAGKRLYFSESFIIIGEIDLNGRVFPASFTFRRFYENRPYKRGENTPLL